MRNERQERDALGRLLRSDTQHSTRTFSYNRLDQITEVTLTPTEAGERLHHMQADTVRFAYDRSGWLTGSMGQREPRRTTFVWERFRLLQETTWQGKRTYLYDAEQSYTLVAAITGRGESRKIWYYHTDVTDTVQEVSASDGTLVWAGYQAGFGENRGNISNSGAYFEQPLRLPGQYFDEETGLHYNLFRYYAPECGRFISQDPIGLNGGINLYAYVKNPLTWIDPLGLAGCNAQQRRNISDLRNGKDVTVRSVDEARALLDNMPDLRPHVDSFPARSGDLYSGTKFSDVWKQPAGTYRGDLYNVKNPLSDVVHNSKKPLHDNNPHYNIIFGDGTKDGIIIVP